MTRCCHILAVQYRSKGGYDMPTENSYLSDIEEILLHRHDNGGDYWATPDKRLLKGAPFTTIESPLYLLELGVSADDPIMKETANLIFSTWKEDGRFKIFPTGSIYPCQTAESARTLCYMGYANDSRIETTFQHLLNTQHTEAGGVAINFLLGMGLKQNTQIPIPHLLRLMRSDLVIISIMSLPWTKLLIFCLTIGQLESLSGLAITELELCLCKLNIHFATITFFNMFMSYPSMTMPKRTVGFWRH